MVVKSTQPICDAEATPDFTICDAIGHARLVEKGVVAIMGAYFTNRDAIGNARLLERRSKTIMADKQYPIGTGQVVETLAQFSGVRITEQRLHSIVRQGYANPRRMLGRRLWFPCDIEAAADRLGLLTPQLRNHLSLHSTERKESV